LVTFPTNYLLLKEEENLKEDELLVIKNSLMFLANEVKASGESVSVIDRVNAIGRVEGKTQEIVEMMDVLKSQAEVGGFRTEDQNSELKRLSVLST
jgi:hypothetical protein